MNGIHNELPTLVMIATDCTCRCKSNYHSITTTTTPTNCFSFLSLFVLLLSHKVCTISTWCKNHHKIISCSVNKIGKYWVKVSSLFYSTGLINGTILVTQLSDVKNYQNYQTDTNPAISHGNTISGLPLYQSGQKKGKIGLFLHLTWSKEVLLQKPHEPVGLIVYHFPKKRTFIHFQTTWRRHTENQFIPFMVPYRGNQYMVLLISTTGMALCHLKTIIKHIHLQYTGLIFCHRYT